MKAAPFSKEKRIFKFFFVFLIFFSEKMTFSKNPKKCFCPRTRGIYIKNLKWISKKLWPVGPGHRRRRRRRSPTVMDLLCIGKSGCSISILRGQNTMQCVQTMQIYYQIAPRSPSAIAARFKKLGNTGKWALKTLGNTGNWQTKHWVGHPVSLWPP